VYRIDLLRGSLAAGEVLSTEDMLTYLHTTVSDRWHPISCPVLPIDLDVLLADRSFYGGWYPHWGDPPLQPGDPDDRVHVRIASISGYPGASIVGMVRGLEAKDIDFRWVTRWICEDKYQQGKLLRKTEKAWVGEEKGFMDRISENVTARGTRVTNVDAEVKGEQVLQARREFASEVTAYGQFGSMLVTWHEDKHQAEENLLELLHVFEGAGFTMTREREHATAMWFASHPGNKLDGVRQTPQKSLTLAHLRPGLSATYMGPARDEHLQGRPWYVVHGEGTTRFNVVNHVLDNGHYLVLGPTRAGKSVTLAHQVWSWLHGYPGAQAFPFDKDLSMRCLTLCAGGIHADLGTGHFRIQPFRLVNDPIEAAWAGAWVRAICAAKGVANKPGLNSFLDDAIEQLGKQPISQRTVTEYSRILRVKSNKLDRDPGRPTGNGSYAKPQWQQQLQVVHREVLDALRPFEQGGQYGFALDHSGDDLLNETSHFITFEMATLLSLTPLLDPMLSAVFHRLEGRFDTRRPTNIPLDEGAILAAVPAIGKQGKEWLMTRAKKNVSIGFATHSIAQIFGDLDNTLGALLFEGCQTMFALPNPAARTPKMAKAYESLGFNDTEIQLISRMRPQRECYYSSPHGKQRYRLELSPFLLSILARNSQADHARMDAILAREGREGFARDWLTEEGHHEEVKAIERWQEEFQHAAD